MNKLIHWLTGSIRNKLLMITGTGTSLLLAAALLGLWNAWSVSLLLKPEDAARFQQNIYITMGLMVLAVILAFGSFLWLVQKNITTPAHQLARDLDRLAQGDFTQAVAKTTHDEFGEVAASAEKIRRDLGTIITHVKSSTIKVSQAASALVSASAQVVSGSQSQSESAAATAATFEEVTASINSVAANAENVRKLSQDSLGHTATGNQRLEELTRQMDDAVAAIEAIMRSVNEFVANTSVITTMTQQVKDIADQTNLLALNAAIEAARAGEQGRGFAVVADEVRKLAEKSAQSANEIDTVTRALGQQSEQVNSTIEQGRQLLQASKNNTQNAAQAMHHINEAVERSNLGVDAIALSVKEQTSASNDIASHIALIASMAQENTTTVQQTAQAAQHLEELSSELEKSVSGFKV
ncbi:MAG TPA: methyl-accepting chemotaxis protein [Novimethylophilus sp.]|jgi:methyl-accepting chemotaxis protein|uniref:methyl-accepting chemotaxis protein n=1 Tax=Novimethylophilus sp. TaxID=2137426 RepID=UPI002F3F3135